jgi:coenzyme F420-0:L-glutamate ligase/coenzyme F420-1:gamma-L-glutamate ligase
LAAAGELVKGKMDQVPVAVVRGYPRQVAGEDSPGASALLRDAASDMFSLGTAEARAAGLRAAATLPDAEPAATGGNSVGASYAPGDGGSGGFAARRAVVERALATVADVLAPGTTVAFEGGGTVAIRVTGAGTTPGALIRLGADAHRLRAALAAEGVAATHLTTDDGTVLIEVSA